MAYSICNSWTRLRSPKCLVGKQLQLLYSWEFFLNSACSRWLLRGHMTFNNQTVSCQNLWAGKIAKNLWRQKVIVHCHWLLARFSFINFLAVLPPWTYTKLKLEKISGQKLPTSNVCGVRGGVGPVWIRKRPRNAKVSQGFCLWL